MPLAREADVETGNPGVNGHASEHERDTPMQSGAICLEKPDAAAQTHFKHAR
jgi:hypothetical protein